jgi:hypothetical protein
MTSGTGLHIRLCEIVALEQQWFIARGRQRVGEAVAIVESGRMAAPAETPPGAARQVGLLGVHPEDFDLRPVQPQIEFPTAGIAKTRLDDEVVSRNVAADMSRTGSSAILPSNSAASGSSNRMAATAEVSITISLLTRVRHSR